MQHARRITIILWSICFFILSLYLALITTIFNRSFCESQLKKQETAVHLNMSDEELNKALDKTLDYLAGKSDDLHFNVTLKDGTSREFYSVTQDDFYPYRVYDEYAHMAEVKELFTKAKSLAVLAVIVWVSCTLILLYGRKLLLTKHFRTAYITHAVLVLLFIGIGLYAALDFDSFFSLFHQIFFPGGNWTFPSNSFMFQLFSDLLFGIIYRSLIIFVVLYLLSLTFTFISSRFIFTRQLKTNEKD